MSALPAHPPSPSVRFRPFHVAVEGSQISMPIPAEVDGASAGPGLPGPTFSLTRHTSFEANATLASHTQSPPPQDAGAARPKTPTAGRAEPPSTPCLGVDPVCPRGAPPPHPTAST